MAQKRVLRLHGETLHELVDDDLAAVAGGQAAPTTPVTVCYLYQCPGTFRAGCQVSTVQTLADGA